MSLLFYKVENFLLTCGKFLLKLLVLVLHELELTLIKFDFFLCRNKLFRKLAAFCKLFTFFYCDLTAPCSFKLLADSVKLRLKTLVFLKLRIKLFGAGL